jgi:hypothetical protein
MGKKNAKQTTIQHDERVFRDGEAILSEGDLRELINDIYANYQYKDTQSYKLTKLINFLSLEGNRYNEPEFTYHSERLGDNLNNFIDFLNRNFHRDNKSMDGNTIYILTMPETGFETESFLIEFQIISMDIEKTFKDYRAAAIKRLKK